MQASDDIDAFSVSELTRSIRELLERRVGSVWVKGEISNFRAHGSGHLYFTLKDAGAQIRAVMFRGDASGLIFEPEDGMEVMVGGMVTVYEARGDYQIRVSRMMSVGKGGLQEAFERLKGKLAGEGLFDEERKRELPVFPERVALVSSATGAAAKDFIRVLTRRCPRVQVQLYGVRVQGRGAAREIEKAMEVIQEEGDAEVIILARGGGSIEDLWEFNDESLARAVAGSSIPVVSGVGHEVDFTICDFVADVRAATPSMAAEILCEPDEVWAERVQDDFFRLQREVQNYFKEQELRLKGMREHYVFREPVRYVEMCSQRLDDVEQKLCERVKRYREKWREMYGGNVERFTRFKVMGEFRGRRERLEELGGRLELLSPQRTLERGYAIVRRASGEIVYGEKDVAVGEEFLVNLGDGEIRVKRI